MTACWSPNPGVYPGQAMRRALPRPTNKHTSQVSPRLKQTPSRYLSLGHWINNSFSARGFSAHRLVEGEGIQTPAQEKEPCVWVNLSPLSLLQCSNPHGEVPRQDGRHLLEFICCTNLATSIHVGTLLHHVSNFLEEIWEPPSLWSFRLELWPGLYRHLLAGEETARTPRGA